MGADPGDIFDIFIYEQVVDIFIILSDSDDK